MIYKSLLRSQSLVSVLATQALEHASTRAIAVGAGPTAGAVSLQASVLVPGNFNTHGSVSACRHRCRSTQVRGGGGLTLSRGAYAS